MQPSTNQKKLLRRKVQVGGSADLNIAKSCRCRATNDRRVFPHGCFEVSGSWSMAKWLLPNPVRPAVGTFPAGCLVRHAFDLREAYLALASSLDPTALKRSYENAQYQAPCLPINRHTMSINSYYGPPPLPTDEGEEPCDCRQAWFLPSIVALAARNKTRTGDLLLELLEWKDGMVL